MRALPLNDQQLHTVLSHVASSSKQPLRDYAVILLSFKAGLRAAEIAGLNWRDVCDVTGEIGAQIHVRAAVAKYGSARSLPMHPAIRAALVALRNQLGHDLTSGGIAIVRGSFSGRVQPNTLVQYIRRLYRDCGFHTSSHAGRRTVLTKLARSANSHGCSLYDVQYVAGHRDVSTTEAYVERSDRLAELMGTV